MFTICAYHCNSLALDHYRGLCLTFSKIPAAHSHVDCISNGTSCLQLYDGGYETDGPELKTTRDGNGPEE